jgi:hypothetical protein
MDSDLTPTTAVVKDDPAKPWKTIAAIVSAFLTSFVATNATDLPAWGVGLVTAVIAAIAVYLTPNPKVAA